MLTNKSKIPLGAHDLRIVEGERCFLDRRLNLRLGYGRATEVRDLIRRNNEDFEKRWGPLRHRAVVVQRAQGGGSTETEYWLTKGQALWVCRKSDAANADDVMEEVIKVFLAVDAGASIPDTPWTDTLFAPDAPIIERGKGNIVHVKHEILPKPEDECERRELTREQARSAKTAEQLRLFGAQGRFAFRPPPAEKITDEGKDDYGWHDGPQQDKTLKPGALEYEYWTDREGDAICEVMRRNDLDGDPMILGFVRNGARASTGLRLAEPPTALFVAEPSGKRKQVFICVSHTIPQAIVERAYLRLGRGPISDIGLATLRHFLAF